MPIVRSEDRLVLIRRIREGDYRAEQEFCRAYGFSKHSTGRYFKCYDYEPGYAGDYMEMGRFIFTPHSMEVSDELDEAEIRGHVIFSLSPDDIAAVSSSCAYMKRLDGKEVPYCEVEVNTKSEEEAEEYCRTFDFRWYDVNGRCAVDEDDPKKVKLFLVGEPAESVDEFENAAELYAVDHYLNISDVDVDRRVDEMFEADVRDYVNFGRREKIEFKEGENELVAYVTDYSCEIDDPRNGVFDCEGGAKVVFRAKDPNILIDDLNAFFE